MGVVRTMLKVLQADAYRLLHSRLWWVLVAGLALYVFEGSNFFASGWRSEGVATFAEAARRHEALELAMALLPIWFAWFFGSDLTNRTVRNVMVDAKGRRSYVLAAAVLAFGAIVAVMAACSVLLALNLFRLGFAFSSEDVAVFVRRLGALAVFATAYALVAMALTAIASKNAATWGIASAALLTSTVLFSFARVAVFYLPAPLDRIADEALTTYSLSGMAGTLEGTGVVQPWWFVQAALWALLGALVCSLIMRRKELR